MITSSLLVGAVLRVATADEAPHRLSLPEVLARLSAGDDLVFVSLRPHQEAAWHAFLVQLACVALEAADWPPLPAHAEGWRRLLRGLTTRWPDDEPWCLVVEDWTQPAFLQSPSSAADYRGRCACAQELDVLVTSKNHDEKIGKLHSAASDDVDAWIYALVSLQGFAGYLGRGNFSTMRMNGGFASRPQFRLAFVEGSGAEFLRDVQALRDGLASLWDDAQTIGMGTDEALSLLWLEPWANQALPLSRVHPLCLEVTRRVRLQVAPEGRLQALTAASTGMRVAAKDYKGRVLDPWIPIVKEGEPRALTAQNDTFTYHRLAPLLFDEQRCQLPLLARPTADELETATAAVLRAQVLVGGSGRTDGYLRRDVPMPPEVLRCFVTRRGELALRARLFIEMAARAQGKVLRPALLQYVDGDETVNWQNKDFAKMVDPWVTALQRHIDDVFFNDLFATEEPPMNDSDARRLWSRRLRDLIEPIFRSAVQSLPTRDRSRHLALGRAARLLRGGLREHLADDPAAADGAAAGPGQARAGRRGSTVAPSSSIANDAASA